MNKRQKKIIAIIPARGGSKGLPGKNIKPLLGKPLIAWTIEQAKKSTYIDKLIVSTDYPEIAEISKKYGAEIPFFRPQKYARDDSSIYETISHALCWLENKGEYYDILILLEPTSPLRKNGDIDRAIELFLKNFDKADALVSVGEVHLENPYIVRKINKDGYLEPLIKTNKSGAQRQKLPKSYFPYGVIYLSKVAELKKHKTFYQKKTIPYLIERWQHYEIDDIYDFICVERILKDRINKNNKFSPFLIDKAGLTISGNKIYLKEFTKANLYDKRYWRWLRDIDVIKTIGRTEYLMPIQPQEIENYVKKLLHSKQDYFFAIYLKEKDEFIGTFKIGSINLYHRTADVGILIGDKNYWGRGIGRDVLFAGCNYTFKYIDLQKLTGGCFQSNTAMQKCFESVGFKKEATLRNQLFFEGKHIDHILYGLFRNELKLPE